MEETVLGKVRNQIDISVNKLAVRRYLVLTFLKTLYELSPVSSSDLSRELSLPKSLLYNLLHDYNFLLSDKKGKLYLKSEIRKDLKEIVKTYQGLSNYKLLEIEITKNISSYFTKLPPENRNLDQFKATIETTVARALLMLKKGDLLDREVVFLGDGLTSVAVAFTHQPKKITVLEIDLTLVNLLNNIARETNLNLEAKIFDLRLPLAEIDHECCDLVFTDPPYTDLAISTFLNQAIFLLKKKYGSRIYLCYGMSERANERELKIQKIINDRKLMIYEKLAFFNRYQEGAESIGNSSSLYLLDWTPQTKVVVERPQKKFYTNE